MPPRKRNLRAVKPEQTDRRRATVAQTIEKSDRIFQLVASGLTVTEAGRQMDPPMSEPQASKLWNDALERQARGNFSLRQAMLERELETLRLLKRAFMPRALNGDVQSGRLVLGVVDKIADIAGLNAELKVRISNQRVDDTVSELVKMIDNQDDQIPQLLESGVLIMGTIPDDDETAAG